MLAFTPTLAENTVIELELMEPDTGQ